MQNTISAECFGETIRILRQRARYTQQIFSEFIGIEPQNLSRIERGLNFPSLGTFMNISKILNMTPNELLNVKDHPSDEELDEQIIEKWNKCSLLEKRLIYKIIKVLLK